MGDAVLNVACEKVAKAAGSTGLGYLEVVLAQVFPPLLPSSLL